jgi:uncharacterized GH25 family protein
VNRRKTVRPLFFAIVLVAGTAGSLAAHDLFFRLDEFFAAPGATLRVHALNGTFSSSESPVARDRLRDLRIVSPRGDVHPDTTDWSTAGDTSVLTVRTSEPGTYVIGASLRPREITLTAKEFNSYLAEDGIPDVLGARKKNNELEKDATERYSKHIKALVQVGDRKSGDFSAVLGYPAELVPLDNPYALARGATLRVRAMVDGHPVADQLVVSGGRSRSGTRLSEVRTRTDADGVARIRLVSPGHWYIKFIDMRPFEGPGKIDYESKWATLTFGVR